jgi:hypothetical protein
MHTGPIQVLQGVGRHAEIPRGPSLLIAGATGAMGNEVLRRLAGQFQRTWVLAKEPITDGLGSVSTSVVESDSPLDWTPVACDVGVIMFDPPRLFHDRERALWTPQPQQLPAVAQWLRRSGAETLAIVLPHAQGRLPEALKRGLASLDEQAVAALGFERLLIIRTPQKPGPAAESGFLPRVAHGMLSIMKYMIPSSEQPVRALKVAELLSLSLQLAPAGIHIAAPEMVWRAAQGDMREAARQWLCP